MHARNFLTKQLKIIANVQTIGLALPNFWQLLLLSHQMQIPIEFKSFRAQPKEYG